MRSINSLGFLDIEDRRIGCRKKKKSRSNTICDGLNGTGNGGCEKSINI